MSMSKYNTFSEDSLTALTDHIKGVRKTAEGNTSAISDLGADLAGLSEAVVGAMSNVVTIPGGGSMALAETLGEGPYTIEIEDEPEGGSWSASEASYDNTASGLEASNVQDAIDELVNEKATIDHAHTLDELGAAPAGDYPKTYTETLGANSYLSVSFTSKYASAIISCLETGGVRAEYLYSGYTRGGPQRANLTTLFTGNQMAFSPNKEVSEGYKHGFTLNNISSISCKVLVTVINGSEPIFEVTADNAYETPYVEWSNPPMESGVEYRTTERINGHAVYKKNIGGVIQYRLDGETEWKKYSVAVGADASGTAASAVSAHNSSSSAHADIRQLITAAQSTANSAQSGVAAGPKIEYGTYTGSGTEAHTIYFNISPKVVLFGSGQTNEEIFPVVRGAAETHWLPGGTTSRERVALIWGEKSLNLDTRSDNARYSFNESGSAYYYIAIG